MNNQLKISLLGKFSRRVAMLAIAVCAPVSSWADETQRPHIIMFMSDDHSASLTGCYGDKVIKTPNIDALAAKGMKFTQFFSVASICGPSRTAIHSGMMPPRVGCWRNHGASDPGTRSLPHYLQPLGYRVVATGKMDVKPAKAYPFEKMKGSNVESFLGEHLKNNKGQPLCLMVNTKRPHAPYPDPKGYTLEEMVIPPDMVDTPETRLLLAEYYTEVTEMDEEVGRCFEAVKKAGIENDTLFIYASDHGGQFPRAKWNLYDEGIQMPFVVCWPGKVKPGTVSDALVSSVDLVPTFIEIAGGDPVEGLDGFSFLPSLQNPSKEHREVAYATHTGNPLHGRGYNDYAIRSIRTKTHKYVLNLDPDLKWISHSTDSPTEHQAVVWNSWIEKGKSDPAAARLVQTTHHRPAEELYDLRKDPHELNNLADDPEHSALLSRMRQQLVEWRKEQGDEGEPPEVRQKAIDKYRNKEN